MLQLAEDKLEELEDGMSGYDMDAVVKKMASVDVDSLSDSEVMRLVSELKSDKLKVKA